MRKLSIELRENSQKIATAGNRTRASRVAGGNHTTRQRLPNDGVNFFGQYNININRGRQNSGENWRRETNPDLPLKRVDLLR